MLDLPKAGLIMARRSLRKRLPEPEYLLGYVEDDEPVEKIMKKFKQLEDYQSKVGRENLTSEDCRELFSTTEIGNISNVFKPSYGLIAETPPESSSDSESPNRTVKYIDPVTQSYLQVQVGAGPGQTIQTNIFTAKFSEKFQAVLVNPPAEMTPRNKARLKFLKHCMDQGLVFLWSPKQEIKEWTDCFDKMKFQYVENLAWVKVDKTQVDQAGGLDSLTDFTPNLLKKEKSWPFSNSHLTLLMFRKISPGRLELRHQRTCDVVFDFEKPKKYVYHMIETLLPEAGIKLELWADGETRQDWIHVVHSE